MPCILQVDFPYNGPWGEEMAAAMEPLAESIAKEHGLLWKVWTEAPSRSEAGGIYLFAEEPDAERYLAMHSARLREWGVPVVRAKIFGVNADLSRIDRAPLAAG